MADRTRTIGDGRGGGTPTERDVTSRRAGAPCRWVCVAAFCVGLLALVSTIRESVPLVSGIAIAMLVPAALVDLEERRLPDQMVGPAGAVLLVGTIVSQGFGIELSIARGIAGVAAFAGPLLVLHLVSPRAMGFGDVKAGMVLGFALGLAHWQLALAALALATGLTAAAGILARARTVALGPGLVAAAAVALAAAPFFAPLDESSAHSPPFDRPTGVHR